MNMALDATNTCKTFLKSNFEKALTYYHEIDGKVQDSNAIYKGRVIPYLFQPAFYSARDLDRFHNISKTMNTIIGKTVTRYLQHKEFRRMFRFSKIMEELILVEPGYVNPAPVSRFDIFYNSDGSFKFCELNGDGSSAMNEANTLEKIFMSSKLFKDIFKNQNVKYFELFESWLTELIKTYREFGGKKEKPNIAIVDFKGLGTIEEFKEFKYTFERFGCKTIITDPRNLKYKNKKLCFGDFKLDLIYRRFVNGEAEKRVDEISDFIQAYKERAVCVVGPFRSEIMHNKIFFAVLHDEVTQEYLNSEELAFIKKHVPFTALLDDGNKDSVIRNKDKIVLKPVNLYSAKGIRIGLDLEQDEWGEAVKAALKTGGYLTQEFCVPAPKEVVFMEDKKIDFLTLNSTLGIFNYNSQLKGLYSRFGRKNIIAANSEVFTAPSFIVT